MSIDISVAGWSLSLLVGMTHPDPIPEFRRRVSWTGHRAAGHLFGRLQVLRPFVFVGVDRA